MADRIFNTGRVGFLYRGDWDVSTADYRYYDVVLTPAGLYVNINIPGYTPTGTLVSDTDYWKLFIPSKEADITALQDRLTALERVPTIMWLPEYFVNATATYYTRNFFYKDSAGQVTLHYNFTATDTVDQLILFQLPEGYRPYGYTYSMAGNTANIFRIIGIDGTGRGYFSGASALTSFSGLFTYHAFN